MIRFDGRYRGYSGPLLLNLRLSAPDPKRSSLWRSNCAATNGRTLLDHYVTEANTVGSTARRTVPEPPSAAPEFSNDSRRLLARGAVRDVIRPFHRSSTQTRDGLPGR